MPSPHEVILVVDDEAPILDLTTYMLRHHGYQVLAEATGAGAIATVEARHAPLHLLLTDISMPHMLGPEVAARITSVRPEVRVLYMSGQSKAAVQAQASFDQVIALLGKPFSESTLLATVRSVLDQPLRCASFFEEGLRS